jgi:hypothetical protein
MGERWTRPDRFRPDELDADTSAGDQARVMATARELEWLAATDDVAPSAGFADRVMTAVAAEPTPRPDVAAASSARRGANSSRGSSPQVLPSRPPAMWSWDAAARLLRRPRVNLVSGSRRWRVAPTWLYGRV